MKRIKEEEKRLLQTIHIDGIVKRIQVSKSRKPTYYRQNEVLPKKYQKSRYIFAVPKGASAPLLFDTKENCPVIKNPSVAGTPKYSNIAGQKIWKAQIQVWDRERMMKAVKEYIYEGLKGLKKLNDFPLIIEVEFKDYIIDPIFANQIWDMDNRFIFFSKAMPDVLTRGADGKSENMWIPDDNIAYITGPPSVLYTPISEEQTPSMTIWFYQDLRPCVEVLKKYRNND